MSTTQEFFTGVGDSQESKAFHFNLRETYKILVYLIISHTIYINSIYVLWVLIGVHASEYVLKIMAITAARSENYD